MNDMTDANAGRRHFLIGVAVVAGGVVAGRLYGGRFIHAGAAEGAVGTTSFKPHAFVRIDSDDVVTVIVGKSEMGQGIHTGLAMAIAEELDIDPRRVRVEVSGVDKAFYHPYLPAQFTGGSNSTQTTFEASRRAGATARAMLLAAAARQWSVAAISLRSEDGTITNGQRRARYGDLAALAAKEPVPKDVPLKDAASFKYLGKPQHRLDSKDKVIGKAVFGLDVDLPDMLTAMVARSPVFGGKVRSFDAAPARAVAGVVDVRQVPTGVAVYATNTWAARQGRDALKIQWDEGAGAQVSSASLRAEWQKLAATPGAVAKNVGDVDKAYANAAKHLDVEYELPYLAHACMEPLNYTVHVTAGACEIWAGTQGQSLDAEVVAAALGIDPKNVTVHTTYLGGGFGRRASVDSDISREAAQVANGVGKPVKVVWTREDDTRGGYYRPFSISRVRAAIDARGIPIAIHHRIVGKGVFANALLAKGFVKDGVDPSSLDGSADMAYAVANHRVELHLTNEVVPISFWRSVGNSSNGFVVNTLIDELAALGHRDPVDLRRAMLAGKPRHLAVLEKAVSASGYGRATLQPGHFHGVALQESFGSIVAQIAEVSIAAKDVRVHRVTCVVDCGFAVNPDQVIAQMQSGIIYGLSAALRGEITFEAGRVQQSNFNDYPVVRMNESPAIDVHILNGDVVKLGGVGEPGTPPIAPAVCNAIFAATGKRIRRLPISSTLGSVTTAAQVLHGHLG